MLIPDNRGPGRNKLRDLHPKFVQLLAKVPPKQIPAYETAPEA